MSKLSEGKWKVKSKKYGIEGIICDFDATIRLSFQYRGKKIIAAITRPLPEEDVTLVQLGKDTIDAYMEYVQKEEGKSNPMLYYWNIDREESLVLAHGTVTGHRKLPDAYYIHTSAVRSIFPNKEKERYIIQTFDNIYFCPFCYCDFQKQDEAPELIPEYEWVKENYEGKGYEPSIGDEQILLVLSNFDEYFFHSIYYKEAGEKRKGFCARPYIGAFRDSFIISVKDTQIDLRYFQHLGNIEFYSQNIDGKRFFIENIGNADLYVKVYEKLLQLKPGERKEILMVEC